MTIELIKIEKMGASNWYCIKVDGTLVSDSWTCNLEEAQALYDAIVADPSYLTTREIVIKSQDI